MAKQLVVLVHGMGTHPKGNILKEFKRAVSDGANAFGLSDISFLGDVDYEEFNYSEYFDAIRKQFSDNAEARVKGFGYLAGMGFEESLLKQLTSFETNFGKDTFFYTHWLDVILYSTMYFGEKIRIDFISLIEKLRLTYDHKNIHIISHSLGTAVVHDALAKYYRKDSNPFDDIPDLATGNFNLASLWTFANVSRMVNLLNGLTDPYNSTVVTGKDGCTSSFVNIRHKYDPFTWFKTYNRTMDDISLLENTMIMKVNTHDFYEYVREPKAARGLLGVVYDKSVAAAPFQKAVEEYEKGGLVAEANELRAAVDKARNDPSIGSLKAAIVQFNEIIKLIKDF